MAYEDDGLAHLLELFKFMIAFCLEEYISYGQCLINNQDLRININRYGESQTHEHTAGIGLHRLFHIIADICKIQNILHAALYLLFCETVHGAIEVDIFNTCIFHIKSGSKLQQCLDSAVYCKCTSCRIQYPCYNLKNRGFTGTIRADNSHTFSLFYLKRNIGKCKMFPIFLLFRQTKRLYHSVHWLVIELIYFTDMVNCYCNFFLFLFHSIPH